MISIYIYILDLTSDKFGPGNRNLKRRCKSEAKGSRENRDIDHQEKKNIIKSARLTTNIGYKDRIHHR